MDVATDLFEFTQPNPQKAKDVTFRTGRERWKESRPHSATPPRCDVPTREFGQRLRPQIASGSHLWLLVGNPVFTATDDLLLFGESNASFYAGHGRRYAGELVALGNFSSERNNALPYERARRAR